MVATQNGGHSEWWPLKMVATRNGGHSGWWPLRVAAVHGGDRAEGPDFAHRRPGGSCGNQRCQTDRRPNDAIASTPVAHASSSAARIFEQSASTAAETPVPAWSARSAHACAPRAAIWCAVVWVARPSTAAHQAAEQGSAKARPQRHRQQAWWAAGRPEVSLRAGPVPVAACSGRTSSGPGRRPRLSNKRTVNKGDQARPCGQSVA